MSAVCQKGGTGSCKCGARYGQNGLSGVVAVEGGTGHSLAVQSDGIVRSWGSNWFGQLGDGTTIGRTTPVTVSNLSGAIAVAGGTWHSLASPAGRR
jgi:alpha-tubulin suppressor-like RCC1 family protein